MGKKQYKPKLIPAILKNESGVALPMALSCILIVSVLVMEFSFSQRLSLNLAYNDYESLRAEYLAKSGMNISLLKLKVHNAVRKMNIPNDTIKTSILDMIINTPIMYPFMAMIPGATNNEENSEEEVDEDGNPKKKVGDFEGNFVSEVKPETGMNINKLLSDHWVAEGDLASKEIYDKNIQKFIEQVKASFTSKLEASRDSDDDSFYLKYRDTNIEDVLNNIIDWVDKNSEARSGGYEDDYYQKQEPPYKAKNKVLDDLSELYFIEGVTDDIYDIISESFSVYSESRYLITEVVQNAEMMKWLSSDELTDEIVTEIQEDFNKEETTWNKSVEDFENYIRDEYKVLFNEKPPDNPDEAPQTPHVELTIGDDIERYKVKSSGVFRRTTKTIEIVVDRSDDKHMVVLDYKLY